MISTCPLEAILSLPTGIDDESEGGEDAVGEECGESEPPVEASEVDSVSDASLGSLADALISDDEDRD